MPKPRRKLSAVLRDFDAELNRLERIDAQNQARFSSAPSGKPPRLSKHQMHFLAEAIFFRAFRAYESFVRDCFILYCLGKPTCSGTPTIPFLHPTSFIHGEKLIQSSMRFLDWTNPETIIERAELYLKDGFPFKLPYASHREALLDLARIRNHIAHDSKESLDGYRIVLKEHYATTPLTIPTPGEFLLLIDKKMPHRYKLLLFFDLIRQMSNELTENSGSSILSP
jgi:hypothetical protein